MIAVSDGNDIQWNQSPCNDYSAGDETDIGTQPSSAYGSSNSTSSDYISTLQLVLILQQMFGLIRASRGYGMDFCYRKQISQDSKLRKYESR
ncbi:MAG: hypothetical protein ACLUI0_11870 [Blautia massiliensis (ex Durand et al. 2017)]